MLITPKAMPSAHGLLRKSVNDLKGFRSHNRFIILSEVRSNSIPDIIDLIFNLEPGTSFLDSDVKKTKVMVINTSEVYGDAHGRCDTRTRNVYMHYGYADCSVDAITGDTVLTFTDMDWNVIADKPYCTNHQYALDAIGSDINVSYDQNSTGGGIYRDTNSYNEILKPSPEFYDEKDMLLLGDKEEDYNETLIENKSNYYYESFDSYYNNLYRLKLNDLIDDNTRIFKMVISIENLSTMNNNYINDNLNDMVTEIACELKYSMEVCGFSGGEIDIGGQNVGFNFHNLKSYLRMEKEERYFHTTLFVQRLSEIASSYTDLPIILMFNMRTDNVNVRIIDDLRLTSNGSDSDVKNLSSKLKSDSTFNAIGGAF